MQTIADFPEKLLFLFEPGRYKVVKGGRYGLKSWNFARALLLICVKPSLLWKDRKDAPGPRILCARETQKSIAESVHQLLEDQIQNLQLSRFFTITKSEIRCANGGQFAFAGIRQNVNNVKSFEGFDICWVEEAQNVSRNSWNVLIPTIIGRKEANELWISFNPDLESDETYQRFAVNPPASATVVHSTWKDNPWIPRKIIEEEIEAARQRSEDDYLNVYEGLCKQAVEGAVYKTEIAAAESGQRLTRVPYDPQYPVHTFWDLGWGDSTAIWFAQATPFEFRLIDYLDGSLKGLQYYVKELKERPYAYGEHVLPHDAKAHELGSGRTIEEQLRDHFSSVRVAGRISSQAEGINAVRMIFPKCWFDREKCADGLQSLRHYRYEHDDNLGTFRREPLHDWSSHAAKALETMALTIKELRRPEPRSPEPPRAWSPVAAQGQSWMR